MNKMGKKSRYNLTSQDLSGTTPYDISNKSNGKFYKSVK